MVTNSVAVKAHRLVGLLLLVLWLGVLTSESVNAHASLVGTTPVDGAHMETSPTEITLEFSEPVGIVEGGTLLHSSDAEATVLPSVSSGTSVIITVEEPLADGAYILQWRVISADSHPIAGTVSFTIGDSAAISPIAEIPAAPGWIELTRTVTVAVKYLGMLGAFGVLVVVWRLAPSDFLFARKLAAGLAVCALISILVELPLTAMVQRGATIPPGVELWKAITSLESGTHTATLLGGACLVAVIGTGKWVRGWMTPIVLTLIALLTLLLTGHTRTREPWWLMMSSDAIHLGAGAVWIGGIILLTFGLMNRWRGEGFADPDKSIATVSGFSNLAGYTAVIVIASGATMAVTILDDVESLISTDYGTTMLIKIGLVAIVLLIAATNRYWLIPAARMAKNSLTWLRRLLVAELALLLAVVGVTGALVHLDPNAQAEQSTPDLIFEQVVALDSNYSAQMSIRKTSGGTLNLQVEVIDDAGELVETTGDLELSWFLPERELGPITQVIERDPESGAYLGAISLPISGTWHLEVKANIDRFSDSRTTVEVMIPD